MFSNSNNENIAFFEYTRIRVLEICEIWKQLEYSRKIYRAQLHCVSGAKIKNKNKEKCFFRDET